MYLSVNLLMKLSMLHSAQEVAPPLKSIDAPQGRRASPVRSHCSRARELFKPCDDAESLVVSIKR